MSETFKKACIVLSALGLGVVQAPSALADSQARALRIFDRVAGIPLSLTDSRLAQMKTKLDSGDAEGAAEIAAADDGFLNTTVRDFAMPMTNRDANRQADFNDCAALIVGVAKDDIDARAILTANYIYVSSAVTTVAAAKAADPVYGSNTHYLAIQNGGVNLRTLVQAPQKAFSTTNTGAGATLLALPASAAAGCLTSHAWGQSFLQAGTNRRLIQFMFQFFANAPFGTWMDLTMSDAMVRQDVDRNPGGTADPTKYQTNCRGCHSVLDSMSPAFAYFDYTETTTGVGGVIFQGTGATPTVNAKYFRNPTTFPAGYVVKDDSWINGASGSTQPTHFGWQNLSGAGGSGNGPNSIGTAMANATIFPIALATGAFNSVCRRAPVSGTATAPSSDDQIITSMVNAFVNSGYHLRELFTTAAANTLCVNQ